jgi:hypothetical protein
MRNAAVDSYYLASSLGDLLGMDEGYILPFKWLREHKGLRAAKAFEKLNCRFHRQRQLPSSILTEVSL